MFASTALTVVWTAAYLIGYSDCLTGYGDYLTGYSDCLTGYSEPLSPPYRWYTGLKTCFARSVCVGVIWCRVCVCVCVEKCVCWGGWVEKCV